MRRIRYIILIFLCFFISCLPPKKLAVKNFKLIPPKKWPRLSRPKDVLSFRQALHRSLNFYERLPLDYGFFIDGNYYSIREIKEGLLIFNDCLNQADWPNCLKERFDLYQSRGMDGKGKVLFTGYYEPVLEGSLTPSNVYRYPIYRLPDEWVKIDLRVFDETLPNRVLIGMIKGHKVLPFYTREEIDYQKKLAGKGYEIFWVKDPVELFFLHIQGSGVIKLEDGREINVHYCGSNGHRYQSIGKVLADLNLLSDVNGNNIKAFLKNHPEILHKIFSYNKSYVFFEIAEDGPIGSIGEVLTPKYSIATDPSIFPRGALAYIVTEEPLVDEQGEILRWQKFQSFVLNQDTGGAIKGPGRVDVFFGRGKIAEIKAGYMLREGKIYLLLKKKRYNFH